MLGQMMPKRDLPEYLARISAKALVLLTSEDDHAFVALNFPYVGIDWRQCPNILFTAAEPLNDKGNINVLFKLIQFHFIVLINCNKIYL